jgi:hypothetical protein
VQQLTAIPLDAGFPLAVFSPAPSAVEGRPSPDSDLVSGGVVGDRWRDRLYPNMQHGDAWVAGEVHRKRLYQRT